MPMWLMCSRVFFSRCSGRRAAVGRWPSEDVFSWTFIRCAADEDEDASCWWLFSWADVNISMKYFGHFVMMCRFRCRWCCRAAGADYERCRQRWCFDYDDATFSPFRWCQAADWLITLIDDGQMIWGPFSRWHFSDYRQMSHFSISDDGEYRFLFIDDRWHWWAEP